MTMYDFFINNPNFFAVLAGVFIAVIGIAKQRQTARDKNTLDFESGLEDKADYAAAWKIVKSIVDDRLSIPLEYWAANAQFNSPEAEALRHVLNRWERASNGVERKVYNGDALYEIYGSHVISLHTFLMPYIAEIRSLRLPKAYVKFERLAVNWRSRRSLELT